MIISFSTIERLTDFRPICIKRVQNRWRRVHLPSIWFNSLHFSGHEGLKCINQSKNWSKLDLAPQPMVCHQWDEHHWILLAFRKCKSRFGHRLNTCKIWSWVVIESSLPPRDAPKQFQLILWFVACSLCSWITQNLKPSGACQDRV